jgi:hypothetical protein
MVLLYTNFLFLSTLKWLDKKYLILYTIKKGESMKLNRRDFLKFCGLSALLAPFIKPTVSEALEIPTEQITKTMSSLPFIHPLIYAEPGDLVIIAGNPNTGKTNILMTYAKQLEKQNKKILYLKEGVALPGFQTFDAYDCIIIDNIGCCQYPKEHITFRSHFLHGYLMAFKRYLQETAKVGIISTQLHRTAGIRREDLFMMAGGKSLAYSADRIYRINNGLEIIKDRRIKIG